MNILFIRKSILFITFILCTIGLISIYSASCYFSLNNHGTEIFFIGKQFIGIIIALIAAFISATIKFDFWQKNADYFFLIAIFLCLIVKVPGLGVKINGASRWLNLGVFNFQTSELLKPFFILYLAKIINKYKFNSYKLFFFICLICLITATTLLLQPDFGQTFILLIAAFLLFLTMSPRKKIIFFAFASMIVFTVVFIALKPYRLNRIIIFLNPWVDPQGKGFQIIQSLIAIINGGFFGLGIGSSRQKCFYLPMQFTDFIFSVICEELGMIGGIFIITLFLILSLNIVSLAQILKSQINSIFLYGASFIIFFQAAINVLVSTGAIPTKGIGLPFISYGVSSIIGFGILIGLIISASFEDTVLNKEKIFKRYL